MIGTKRALAQRLVAWYRRARRDLPWRVSPDAPAGARPDPYHVLVSEAMLQQTQVSTVVPYFRRFIQRFPSIRHLADADEQDVLRLWQGLGYYTRARNLRKAAQAVVRDFGGQLPSDVDSLSRLSGVGRYTAGAVAGRGLGPPPPLGGGHQTRGCCGQGRKPNHPPPHRGTQSGRPPGKKKRSPPPPQNQPPHRKHQ